MHVQLDGSTRVARTFADAKKPAVVTNGLANDLEEIMDRYPFVHYSAWPDVPRTLQGGNLALLGQLNITWDILRAEDAVLEDYLKG